MAFRIDESLALRSKLTRAMFSSVAAGKRNLIFFPRQKSRRWALGRRWCLGTWRDGSLTCFFTTFASRFFVKNILVVFAQKRNEKGDWNDSLKCFFQTQIHKQTAPNKTKLCTHLLCICVSVYKLKNSQKNLGPKEHWFSWIWYYLRCARPRIFNRSETGFELNSSKKNTVEKLILAPIFFHRVKKNHPPFF